jgi:hypothetical protein
MRRAIWAALLIMFAASCHSTEKCKAGLGLATPHGKLVSTRCTVDGVDKSHALFLNSTRLVEDVRLFSNEFDKRRTLHIYTSGMFSRETACAKNLYLLDLSASPPLVVAFGVKNACNEFHWASWGDKRSVIALKKNVKFVYENGRLTPPPKGEALWKAIEPPHAGAGLAIEDAIPFVEVVRPPK